MAHQTTSPLPPDSNGDIRYPSEVGMPLKARCIRCGGQKTMRVGYGSGTCEPDRKPCTYCNGRGYYFLPLGD